MAGSDYVRGMKPLNESDEMARTIFRLTMAAVVMLMIATVLLVKM